MKAARSVTCGVISMKFCAKRFLGSKRNILQLQIRARPEIECRFDANWAKRTPKLKTDDVSFPNKPKPTSLPTAKSRTAWLS